MPTPMKKPWSLSSIHIFHFHISVTVVVTPEEKHADVVTARYELPSSLLYTFSCQ